MKREYSMRRSGHRFFPSANLPQDLAEDAEPYLGVADWDVEAAGQAANFLLSRGPSAGIPIPGSPEHVEEHAGDALDFDHWRGLVRVPALTPSRFLRFRLFRQVGGLDFGVANKFI